MKNNVIFAAVVAGVFQMKNAEKRNAAIKELQACEEFSGVDVSDIIEAETLRRHIVSQDRIKKSLAKIVSDAAKPLTGGVEGVQAHVSIINTAGHYILTVAQNNTEVDNNFLQSLENYARIHNASIMVAKTTYNKNAFSQIPSTEGVYYDSKITKYIVEGTLQLCPTFQFLADANVIVTSRGNPLGGFESASPVGVSIAIGTASIQLNCAATMPGTPSKALFGTGAVTQSNYISRKAGNVANATHNISALLVIVDNQGNFKARHIQQMAGSVGFIDDNVYYRPDTIENYVYPAALQFGDVHAEKLPAKRLNDMCDLVEYYNPDILLLHDSLDFASRNHHNIKSPTFIFAQHCLGNTVENDIKQVVNVVHKLDDVHRGSKIILIESNHDQALGKYLDTTSPQDDPVNAITWLKCTLAKYEAIKYGDGDFHILQWACYNIGALMQSINVQFHGTDESVKISGVECGHHGHNGINGAKGSGHRGFAKLGEPINTGHTHSPGISNGLAYVAGVAAGAIDMGYNKGAGSWRAASIITMPIMQGAVCGARQVIFHD